MMWFPDTVDEFMELYKMTDTKEVYSNGTEYVPIFRAKQWFEHEEAKRTAKVISDDVIITVNGYNYHHEEYLCNACKNKVFSCDSYCSHCGAKLDWRYL